MLRTGDRVGNYEVEALLGVGGMASVFRARHTTLGSAHAIKVLNAEVAEHAVVRDRFVQEGRLLAQVRHPGLVRVTDVVSHEGVAGLVMDLLDGEDLASRLRAGPLSPEVAAGIMLQVLSAVGHAHRSGVVHRDLKPANIFLVHRPGKFPLVKVLDFGIAKLRGLELTQGVQALGTVAYMSPEQIETPSKVDARSDLFSLGVVLFEMVAGEPPYSGDTDFAIMQRIVEGRPEPLPDRAGVLAPVIQRALRVNPDERFPDAGAFAEVLRGLAPLDVRHAVAEWEAQGASVDPSTEAPARTPQNPHPLAPGAGDQPVDARAARSLVRWVGGLQLVSGLLNLLVMSWLQFFNLFCVIFWFPWGFGFVLLVVGCIEVLTGLSAILTGTAAIRRTATLEVVSLAAGGLVSGVVGMYVLSLRRRYPGVLT